MRQRLNLLLCSAVLALGRISSPPLANAANSWHVPESPAVVTEDLRFTNGDAQLVGTVYLPESGNHLPAVVVLHDASIPSRQAALYRHLSEGLPAMGIAVLIFDRRATGQSSGSRENVNLTTLADDGIAGQRALSKIARIDPNRIGFWGLSQGGWLAVLATVRSPNAAFAISVSAPLVSPEDQMQFAMSNLMKIRGFPDGDIQQMLDTRKVWAGYLRGENSRAIAVAALQNAQTQPWFGMVYLPKPSELPSEEQVSHRSNDKDYDPIATTTKAHVPLFFLYGSDDPWVPVAKSVARLQSLTHVVSKIDYAVVANANHEMMIPSNDTMEINQNTIQNNAPQAASYFMILGSWLSSHVVVK
jgi:alpha-beta hydrolase superfamily lysophospholipase